MTIEFGDWQLRKLDAKNWELYHMRATRVNKTTIENGTAGKIRWHTTGRYYQARTFAHALEYAADYELRNNSDDVVSLSDGIETLDETLRRFESDFKRSMQAIQESS